MILIQIWLLQRPYLKAKNKVKRTDKNKDKITDPHPTLPRRGGSLLSLARRSFWALGEAR